MEWACGHGHRSVRVKVTVRLSPSPFGSAASLAVDGGTTVQDVDMAALRERLLADKQVLEWKGKSGE